jgi:nitrate reductase alpha subunit
VELAAAAHVHTIRTWGPDRIAGFSPIPAMSMVSHAAGARFHALIGAPMLSFYDWYADLHRLRGDRSGESIWQPLSVPGGMLEG